MGELLHVLGDLHAVHQCPALHEVVETVAEGRRHIDQLLESGDQVLDVIDIFPTEGLCISFCKC